MSDYLTFFNAIQVAGIIAAFWFAHWVKKDNKRLHLQNQEKSRTRQKRQAQA